MIPRPMLRSLSCALLLSTFASSASHAGMNAAGVAWLAWRDTTARPTGFEGWTDNIPAPSDTVFPLYVHFDTPTGFKALGITLRWRSDGTTAAYTLAESPTALPSCGHVDLSPPSPAEAFGDTFQTTIALPNPATRCLAYWFAAPRDSIVPVEFSIAAIVALDSLDNTDTLLVLGPATVANGLGTVEPGLVMSMQPTSSGSQAWRELRAASTLTSYRLRLRYSNASSVSEISALRDSHSIAAPSLTAESDTTLTFSLPSAALTPGPYDIAFTLTSGAADTLRDAIRLLSPPAYLDSLPTKLTSLTEVPLTQLSCIQRVLYHPSSEHPGGATYGGGYCNQYAPGNLAYCDLTYYPSYYDSLGVTTYLSRTTIYTVNDCSTGLPMPYLNLAMEIRRANQSGSHCHGNGSNEEVGSAVLLGGGGTLSALGDGSGGYICTGNTGSDGLQFRVRHIWPLTSGVMNLLVYSTTSGQPYYNARDTIFHYCSSMYNALTDVVQGIPDTLVLIGGDPQHANGFASGEATNAWNHFGRPGMKAGLVGCARKFTTATDRPVYVNDIALDWGGTFDLHHKSTDVGRYCTHHKRTKYWLHHPCV